MPSALFVCVSWISFVVPIDAIPGRMALLVTLLLVLINMFNSSVEKEPLTHEITALSGTTKKREIKGHILTLVSDVKVGYCPAYSLCLVLSLHMRHCYARNSIPKEDMREKFLQFNPKIMS